MVAIDFSTEANEQILNRAEHVLGNDNLPEWERDIWTFLQSFLNPSVEMFSIFTSGSTGKPKIIKHSRSQLESSAKATIDFFRLKKGKSALLAIPAKHIGGRMMIVRSALAKLKLNYIPPSAKPLNAITLNDKFHFAAFTPMQLANCLSDPSTAKKVNNIELVILGGGEISNTLMGKIKSIGTKVFHTYGMTETASHVALRKMNGDDVSDFFEALPGISFEADERNCLVIHAPPFSNEKIVTNDVVRLLSSTTFEWQGRADNVINSGGIKIQPEALERKLFGAVPFRFFFFAEKNELLGESVVMVVEAAKFEPKHYRQIIRQTEKFLTKYEQPKKILILDKFRETATGKIMRKESHHLARVFKP